MIKTLAELSAVPEYQRLDYAGQQRMKRAFFDKVVAQSPEFNALPEPSKQNVFFSIMDTAPAIEDLGGISLSPEDRQAFDMNLPMDNSPLTAYKKAVWLHDRALQGDEKAADDIKRFVAGQTIANQTMIGQMAMGVSDFFQEDDTVTPLARDKAQLEKMTDYLKSSLSKGDATALGAVQAVSSLGANIVEGLAFNVFAIGSAASKGTMLTRGIFEGLETAATKMLPGLGKTAMQTLVPTAAEAGLQGVAEVLRTLPTLLNDGSIKGNKEVLENVATNFGVGALMDIGLYYAGKAIYRVAKPAVNMFRKMDLNDAGSIDRAFNALGEFEPEKMGHHISLEAGDMESPALIAMQPGVARDEVIERIARSNTRLATKKLDPTTPEGFTAYAMRMQHDVDFKDGKIILSQFDKDNVKFTASSMREANDYLANYMRTTDATKFASDAVSAARAASPEVFLKVESVSPVKADQLPTDSLLRALRGNVNGKIEPRNVSVVAENLLKRAGTLDAKFEVARIPDMSTFMKKADKFSGNKIYVPGTLRTSQDVEAYGNYLHSRMSTLTKAYGGDLSKLPTIQELRKGMNATDTANPANMQTLVAKLGGKLDITGSTFELTLPGNAPQIFHSVQETAKEVAQFRVKNLPISVDELQTHLNRSGRSLTTEKTSLDMELYVVRDLDGSAMSPEGTLEELVTKFPQFMPKLPENLSPELAFVGDTNRVRVLGDLASGTEKDLRQYLDGFVLDSEKAMRHVSHQVTVDKFGSVSADMLQASKNRFVLEVPDMGFKKSFATPAAAKKFLDNDLRQYHNMEKIANERSYRLDLHTGSGITATSRDGKSILVHSTDELQALLKDSPDSSGAKEFFSSNHSIFSEELAEQAHAVAEKTLKELYPDGIPVESGFKHFTNLVGSYIKPMNDTVEQIGKLAGKTSFDEETLAQIAKDSSPEIAARLRGVGLTDLRIGFNGGAQAKAVEVRKAEGIMDRFLRIKGKPIDVNTANVMTKLLEVPESLWEEGAKRMGFEFTKDHVLLLKNTKRFFDYYGDVFGVDVNKMFSNYSPKLRSAMSHYMSTPELRLEFARKGKDRIIHELFGADPEALRVVNFFAKHNRLEAFLGEGDNKNLIRSMKFFIDSGMQEKYMGPIIETGRQWMKNVGRIPGITEDHTRILSSWFESISGESLKGGDALISSASKSITQGLAKWMQVQGSKHVPTSNIGKAYAAMADEVASQGALEWLNTAVTYSTLGARPLRGLYNMMQFNNTIGVFGHYADDAMRDMMSGSAFNIDNFQALLRKYMNDGIITTKVFASGHTNPKVSEGVFEMSMRNQQNSEYMTRVATALTIEKNFKEVLPFYASGKIDAKQFLKHSKLEFLDDGVQKKVMELLAANDPEAAMHLYQTEGVRILMGDYDASNYPMSFKGAIGRLFGRFGVYPVNQVAMYQRMLTKGSPASIGARVLRFGVVTTATYEVFKMAGVNYTGFLAYDPFTFSGGPIFKLGLDILNSRDSGPQGAMARKEAIQGMRLAVPFASQANKMLDAYESGSNGEIHKALIEALSGTYTPDSLLTPMFQ